jgi:meiotic recombination protein SPO11
MDFDPDGVAILSTYKYGSSALAHENAALILPSMQWIGVKSTHIARQNSHHQAQGLLKLSARDRRLAQRMLDREPFTEYGLEPECRRELQTMLMLNVKAEIQLLEADARGLQGWFKDEGIFGVGDHVGKACC